MVCRRDLAHRVLELVVVSVVFLLIGTTDVHLVRKILRLKIQLKKPLSIL